MKKERLDKILSSQNIGTRKEVGKLIRSGCVAINGAAVIKPQTAVDASSEVITVNSRQVCVKKYLYIMMNKPCGVLSASRDKSARTVTDLLPQEWHRRGIFPAGRLDKDTEGLLILTDDGAFAHKMLAPKSHVVKWYEARLSSPVTEEDRKAFRSGILLSDAACLPAELKVLKQGDNPLVLVGLREGKFHQVKRMFQARNNHVLTLKRVRIGNLSLDTSLGAGEARELSKLETEEIFD